MKNHQEKPLKKILAFIIALSLVLTGFFPLGPVSVQAAEPDNPLILYYDFNLQNSYSTVINDASGNGKNGELQRNGGGSVEGTYTIGNANIYGKTVKALTLTGGETGPYLRFPNGILNGYDAVTISVWVNLSTDTGYQRIWDFGSDTSSYLYLLSDGGNTGFKGYASGITTSGWSSEQGVEKGSNIEKNRWVLTTVVMDGTNMSLYENGQLVGTKDTGIKLGDLGATSSNYLGKGQFDDNPTEGKFAEFKIYNGALTAEEIAGMYNVSDADVVSSDKSELQLGNTTAVTSDFSLPTTGANGSTITWTSNNSAIAIQDGVAKVTRPDEGAENAVGKLTATITYKGISDTKDFDVTVLADFSDLYIVEHDVDVAITSVGDLSSVMADVTLPVTGEWGSVISWESQNPAITVEGEVAKVTRPTTGEPNAIGKLIATASYGSEEVTKEIDTTVIARHTAPSIVDTEEINVTTLAGRSPVLPNYVKVTYSDSTTNKLKTIWPTSIDASKYASAGTFTVNGNIVGEKTAITANVTVLDEAEVTKEIVSSGFDLYDISLDTIDGGSILTENRDRDIAYLKLLDRDRMLYNFYQTFGLTDKMVGVSPLGGWDEPDGLLRGHSTGHYMSALALAYASTGDEELKENLNYVVNQLHTMQLMSEGDPAAFTTKGVNQSLWSTDPKTWGVGFVSAYSPDQFALLEQYTPYAQIWAPYYTLHKLIAGLLDAYTYTDNEEALDVAKSLGKWVYTRLSGCSQAQLSRMWDMYIAGEFGGFNESMAKLYLYTGDEDFLKGAKLFDNTKFFDNLAKNTDDIAGRHANQHLPQIIGALEMYAATVKDGNPEVKYYDIAENFWQMVVSRYAYSIGGVGTGEKFTQPYEQANSISGTTNCETCCAYNLLKLTKMLNNYNPDNAEYMDYYERTLYNQILASQSPNVSSRMHNGVTYMLPIGPGSQRSYSGDYNSFTCCHGTGMENHVKYQEAAYEKTGDTLYVSLYLPTTVQWEEKGVKITQETNFPSEDTTLTVSELDGATAKSFDMKLRVPYWATKGFTVKVNDVVVVTNPEISTYVTLDDIEDGDVIEINMPWTLHLDQTPDKIGNSTVASVMYGPYVMPAQTTSTAWKTLILSSVLPDSIKVSTDAATDFPTLTSNGYHFAPMFSPEYATKAYDTYFKILIADDDGSKWYEAYITNTTPRYGTFTIDADMVQEGGSLVIQATPNEGYMVKNLLINGQAVTIDADNTYTVKNVNSDLNIEGSFRLINPPKPDSAHLEFSAAVSSDYTASWENLEGIKNDWEPTRSAAGTGRGWGNWSQAAGSEHYVMYEWDTAVTMDQFQIYWYDDNGGTRIPGSIKVMYLDNDGNWQEAQMREKYEDVIARDQYNIIHLTPITTMSVKLVLTVLDEGEANGILRWKVSGESPVTVTSVIVAPSTVSVQKGTTQTFTAAVNGTNNPAQTVTWSVDGNTSVSTNIDASGLLTVAADENAATLTVTATSTVDNNISGKSTVTVTTTQPDFIAVTDITGVPATATAGAPLTLTGTVAPANATNQTVVWSINNAGDTGASIVGNTLSTTAAGTVVVRATIINGITENTNYTQDFNITVTATPVTTYTVKASANSGGSISPNGAVNVTEGSSQTFTITPNSGYRIDSVMVDGVDRGAITTYTFTNVTANHTITATFKRKSSGGGSNGSAAQNPPAAQNAPVITTATDPASGAVMTTTVSPDGDREVKIELSTSTASNRRTVVHVPVPRSGPGTIAVLVKSDGTEEIIRTSVAQNGEILVPISASGTIKIIEAGQSFADTSRHWASGSVTFVTARGLFSGTSEKSFSPDTAMTRGMLVTVLHRLENTPASGTQSFADVQPGRYYADAVAWAAQKGIVEGTDNGFKPDTDITREQLAAILYRYAAPGQSNGSLDNFPDSGDVSAWASESMRWAVGIGLFSGNSSGKLNPRGNATRAEVAAILQRFITNTTI